MSFPPTLLSRMCAALAGCDPASALRDVLLLGSESGVVQIPGSAEAARTLDHAGRSLTFSLHVEDCATRELVLNVLQTAFARAAEHDELRRSRERLAMLSEASFEGILVHVEGVVIDANHRLCEMLGYEHAELLGDQTLPRCVAPEDLPMVLQRMAARLEGAYTAGGLRKDGSRFRAELLSKQGQLGERPVRVVAVRDVTERERIDARLRESEARLRDLAERAFDLIVLSRDDVIVDVGGRVEALLGYSPEQAIGRSLAEILPPSAANAETKAELTARAHDALAYAANGEAIPVEVVSVVSGFRGEPVRVDGLRDQREVKRLANERRKLEQQIERSQRLDSLGVLAGGIAHDFNNLLVAVLGNAELLTERLVDPGDLEAARAIGAAGKRAAGLTAQMLAYAGQRDLGRREPLDVDQLWSTQRGLLVASVSKKARLVFSAEAGSVLLGDRTTLTQVLINLLTNASDALEDKAGTISIRASRVSDPGACWANAFGSTVGPGQWILIEIEDSGMGMDDDTLSRAFEPFFSTKPKGHGLGLPACLGIVTSHGGAMLVDSEPGKGSCFSVLWPAAELLASESVPRPSLGRSGARKVLVVDDEPSVRSLLRRLLESRGYNVVEASGGREALELVEQVAADVMLLDVTMPDIDGIEVVKRVRSLGLGVPIVLSSGYLDVSSACGLDHTAFQGFVRKPYRLADLIQAIEQAVQQSGVGA